MENMEAYDEEIFCRTLEGKPWTNNPFNFEAFKSSIVHAWRLKNRVEVLDQSRNLFQFHLYSYKDTDLALKFRRWSFDRNLLVLKRVSRSE